MKENRGDDILAAIGQSEQSMRSPSWRFKKKAHSIEFSGGRLLPFAIPL
jgi:hypothetical protein